MASPTQKAEARSKAQYGMGGPLTLRKLPGCVMKSQKLAAQQLSAMRT